MNLEVSGMIVRGIKLIPLTNIPLTNRSVQGFNARAFRRVLSLRGGEGDGLLRIVRELHQMSVLSTEQFFLEIHFGDHCNTNPGEYCYSPGIPKF